MSFKKSFNATANKLKNNELINVNLVEELKRFENERNGCESLLGQSKLVERFFEDSQMNDLSILVQFFRFMQKSLVTSRQNAVKLVLRLPGSSLLSYAYAHLKPSPTMDNDDDKNLLEKFMLTLTKVLQSLLELHPSCYSQVDSMGIFDRMEAYAQKSSNDKIQLEVTTLISQLDRLREQTKRKQKAKVEIPFERDDPPPDDFHQLSIYPTLNEIFQQQTPYLRRNITAGQYKDGTHYLDIHFRLLREDFLWPLREAICQYMSEDNRDISFRNSNVRLYRNTILTGSTCANVGILFSLALDNRTLPKSINWSNSRRLIYGNLLAATFDNFVNSCFLLTVEDRSNIDKNGTILVRCQKELCDYKLMRIPPGTSFTLLETTSYFEAYRPILQALQNIKDDKIPLDKYLLHCEKNVNLPNYFESNATIDFRPILVKDIGVSNEFHGSLSNIKDLSTWPDAKQLGLDDSQYKALELALTKSVALIQGPPGCGKTFLGVRLAELFYHNRKQIVGCQKPILMICYTNHALDQFLSSIIKKLSLQPGQIVRVGGRSAHLEIEPFLIQKLRQQRRDVRSRNEELSTRYEILNNIRQQISDCQETYYQCSQQILNIHQLLKVMDRNQFLTLIHPILSKLDIYNDHWNLRKGGIYCCRRHRINPENSSDEDEDSDDDDDDSEDDEPLSRYEHAARMKNRIDCHRLDDLSEHDQNEIKQLFIKWLDDTHLNIIVKQIRAENEDDGEGTFQEQRRKHKKKMKETATTVLKEILNDPNSPTAPIESNTNDENGNNLDDDDEEVRRLDNIENYIPFTLPNQQNDKDKSINTEQLEYMQRLLNNKSALLTDDVVQKIGNLWVPLINKEQRQALYRYWLWKYVQLLTEQWFYLNEQYDENYQSMQDLWLANDRLYMENAFIIAMTTHCASRYQKVLKQLEPRICIVEEAAEVFESHIVTAIGERIEHLILIGDHVQLRPSPNVYTLAKKFNLDVSLFERLIKNDMPSVQLCVQHRSIPIISSLTHHFYTIPIINHESVLNRPLIKGVTQPLYFINHKNYEEDVADGASKRNLYESNYVLQLADYLLHQGYEKNEITILTTYMGQRQQIQKQINQNLRHLKGIHVTVVDNFQGEENRIILLSLVRSNIEKRLGYVSVDNRICVALSRAQDGFYVVGNFDLFAACNETWKMIVSKMTKLNLIGTGLRINCVNHPDNQLLCINPNDFGKRPLGGCGLKCETRLTCGHQCPLSCHSTPHDSIKCVKSCLKKYDDCTHQCEKRCHAPNACLPCSEMIQLKMPNCEHTSYISCFMRKIDRIECAVLVPYKCPAGHQVQVRCCDLRNKELKHRLCNHPCDFTLECGHRCKGTCSTCLQGRFHCPCDEQELIVYICGHARQQRCHELGPRCEQPYIKLCDHPDEPNVSRSPDQCLLYQCNRYCQNKCKHTRCQQRCRNECDRPLCHEKCSRRFQCEHYCNGICGEPCIDCLACRERDLPSEIRQAISRPKNLRFATFVQLECGHLFKTEVLDQHVDEFENKNFPSNGFMYVEYPRCPICQSSMVRCKRYSGLIKKIQSTIDSTSVVEPTLSQLERLGLLSRLAILNIHFKVPGPILEIITKHSNNNRHQKLTELFLHVINLFQKLSDQIEPEREKLLKSIYEYVEKNNSIFLTRQQWSDLENEYNRLIFIDRFRTFKQSFNGDINKCDIDTLDDILFGPNPFSKFACEICCSLLNEDNNNGDDDDKNNKWKSILFEKTEWNDFEKDRLMCDGKWVVCPQRQHLLWLEETVLTEKSKCGACVLAKESPVPRAGIGRGRGHYRPFRGTRQ